jgi:hypothetical protein
LRESKGSTEERKRFTVTSKDVVRIAKLYAGQRLQGYHSEVVGLDGIEFPLS